MSEGSTNVELNDFEVIGGNVITNPENGLTEIPPKGQLQKVSTTKEPGMIEIVLIGQEFLKEIRENRKAKEKNSKGVVAKDNKGSEDGYGLGD